MTGLNTKFDKLKFQNALNLSFLGTKATENLLL